MPIHDLPPHVLLTIGRQLAPKDLARFEASSKAVYDVVRSHDASADLSPWCRDNYEKTSILPHRLPKPNAVHGAEWRKIGAEIFSRPQGFDGFEPRGPDGATDYGRSARALVTMQPLNRDWPSNLLSRSERVEEALREQGRKDEADAFSKREREPLLQLSRALSVFDPDIATVAKALESPDVAICSALWNQSLGIFSRIGRRSVAALLAERMTAHHAGNTEGFDQMIRAVGIHFEAAVEIGLRGQGSTRALAEAACHASPELLQEVLPIIRDKAEFLAVIANAATTTVCLRMEGREQFNALAFQRNWTPPMVKSLLEACGPVHAKNEITLLSNWLVVAVGDRDPKNRQLVEPLVRAGADICASSLRSVLANRKMPLLPILETLSQVCDIASPSLGPSLLYGVTASTAPDADACIRHLAKLGVNLDASVNMSFLGNPAQEPPLLPACRRNAARVALLLQQGASPHAKRIVTEGLDVPALEVALACDNIKAAEHLLNAGATFDGIWIASLPRKAEAFAKAWQASSRPTQERA